ncbi:hypothetical protein LEP1GSC101_2816 [Leptospira borgpetersenii str. UI 09149]|nr:hypothetical protein LEP1GSC101_2816 [Leptospira borgpetersenii str. UI 09149]
MFDFKIGKIELFHKFTSLSPTRKLDLEPQNLTISRYNHFIKRRCGVPTFRGLMAVTTM